MPNVEKTPRQTIRVEKDLWDKAGRVVGSRNRGAAIRDYLRWLTHETDDLPPRPEQPPVTPQPDWPSD